MPSIVSLAAYDLIVPSVVTLTVLIVSLATWGIRLEMCLSLSVCNAVTSSYHETSLF